ncbi:MAG: peptidase M14 [Ignavibacteriae bacterium]|nr:peptidase M14 [Ignavibacteriota bacterium]NOG98183.1 peptidase M14 [Ignavibacteriota bacterium]
MPRDITTEQIFDHYSNFYEKHFANRRFNHADILPLVNSLKSNKNFAVSLLGRSVEDREIFSIKWGEGKTKVLLWSQMHGDEPTATMAIFDLINFLNADDEFNDLRETLNKELSIYFIPMLNPDGAERVIRENAIGIDLNRDAQKLAAPESRILKSIVDELKPEYGFNLHDQDIRWSAGGGSNPATIALLSPQFDDECTLNEVRENAIKVIADIYTLLEKYIPGSIAKYGEEYEPRSFGDSITEWGTSVILIESGKRRNDPEKEFIRKLNFASLIEAFKSIAAGSKNESALKIYKEIPNNGKLLYDLILRNLNYNYAGSTYNIDVAVNIEEYFDSHKKNRYFRGKIESIGDLESAYGYDEIDCTGMNIYPGKIFINGSSQIGSNELRELLNNGYTHIEDINSKNHTYTKLPLNIIKNKAKFENEIRVNRYANFFAADSKVNYTIVNGFVYDCNSKTGVIKNGLVF